MIGIHGNSIMIHQIEKTWNNSPTFFSDQKAIDILCKSKQNTMGPMRWKI